MAVLLSQYKGSTPDRGWQLFLQNVSGAKKVMFNLYASDNSTGQTDVGGITIASHTWTHIAVVRNGNVWTIYKNGVSAATTTVSATLAAMQASFLGIGRQGDNTDNYFTGFMDEIRISKGIARWTANFSVPVFPYQTERRLLTGTADFTGDPSGSSMKYRLKTLNTKNVRLYGASLTWG